MIRVVALALLWLLTTASPASAEPVSAALAVIGTWVASGGAVAVALWNSAVMTLASTALSMLQKSLRKKPTPPGIKIERTLTGGTVSRSMIVGYYATAGSHVTPPMSHGDDGKTPNAYLTHVIALSDFYTTALTGIVINGEFVEIDKASSHTYGWNLKGKYAGKAWVKFYNGRQSTADSMLVSKYGFYVRPWQVNRIGTGVSYAIVTYKFDQDLYKGEPEVRFELQGAPLYDIRKDSTRGGSGTQRLENPATWGYTTNNAVIIWNLLHGIPLPGGQRYGGEASVEDLPLANWVAAMNACDEEVLTAAGFYEPRYRCGYEIALGDEEPADVIDQLLKACSGLISEVGGVYKIRVGAPALPVMFITDDDIIVSREQDFDPFPAINQSINSVYASFPHPNESWATHDAPPLINPDFVARDDGVENPAELQFPAAPFPLQVQRIMQAWLNDDQRWRRHNFVLGPYGFPLEPMDVIEWSSARNGYVEKLFEIDTVSLSLATLHPALAVREVDPSDYDWSTDDERPDPVSPGEWLLPDVQAVPGWSVAPSSIKDDDGDDRRPALLCGWTGDAAEDATALNIEVRRVGTTDIVARKTVTNIAGGQVKISEAILPATSYEARARYVVERPTEWSSWISVTTGDILLSEKDGVTRFPDGTVPTWAYPTAADLPVPPVADDQYLAFVEEDGKLYRWTGAEWTAAVPGADIEPGSLDRSAFVPGVQPVGVGDTLPTLPDADWPEGAMFINTATNKTYVNRDGAWSSQIGAGDITGELAAVNIPGLDASKIVSGAFGSTRITDGAITNAKLANNLAAIESVSALPSTGNFRGRTVMLQSDGKLYRWNSTATTGTANWTAAVASADISGQLTSDQIAGLVASKITGELAAVNIPGIDASKIVSGSFDSSRITDGAITNAKLANNLAAIESVSALPSTGNFRGRTVMLQSDGKLYRWNSTATTGTANWTAAVPAVDLTGMITTTQIADNAITTGKLTSNAVTADKITGGAVTTDKLAAGAVTADKIEAGTITAAQIGAGSITTSRLLIAPNNLIPNADFATGGFDDWTIYAGGAAELTVVAATVAGVPAGAPAKYVAKYSKPVESAGSTISAFTFANAYDTPGGRDHSGIAVKEGEEYHISVYAAKSVDYSGTFRVQAYYLYGDGTLGTVSTGRINVTQAGLSASAFQLLESNITVPANAVRMWFYVASSNHTVGAVYYTQLFANRRADANLIVDGAVITDKLAANAVVAGKIAAGSIITDKLATNAVTADKILAGAVVADKIGANAVTTAKLDAGAVTTAKLAAGAVTADKIEAGTITAAQIAGGTITGDKISTTTSLPATLTVGNSGVTLGSMGDDIQSIGWAFDYPVSTAVGALLKNADGSTPISPTLSPSSGPHVTFIATAVVLTTGTVTQAKAKFRWNGTAWELTKISERGTTSNHPEFYLEGGAPAIRVYNHTSTYTVRVRIELFPEDPADVINANTTRIEPGRILVAGSTTLDEWRNPADLTKIEGGRIATNTITATQINSSAITTDKLAANAVVAGKIASGSIITDKLATNAVTTDKIEALAITTAKLAAGAVVADKISAGAIVADKIGAGAITTAKLDASAVTADKLASNAVTADKITAGAVTAAKINVSSLAAITADMGLITAGTLQFTSGSYKRVDGASLGTGSDILLWFGPSSIANASITKANGVFCLANDGKVYYGGVELPNTTPPKVDRSNWEGLIGRDYATVTTVAGTTAAMSVPSTGKFRVEVSARVGTDNFPNTGPANGSIQILIGKNGTYTQLADISVTATGSVDYLDNIYDTVVTHAFTGNVTFRVTTKGAGPAFTSNGYADGSITVTYYPG